MSLSRRRAGLLFAAAAGLVLVPLWLLPNVAGTVFVDVRPVVMRTLSVAGTGSSGVEVALDVANNYPLPVVLSYRGSAFRVALFRRLDDGLSTQVWEATGDDPGPQEGSDSPAGGAPDDYTVAIPSGKARHSMAAGGATLVLPGSLDPGVYELHSWAYGVAAPPLTLDLGSRASAQP